MSSDPGRSALDASELENDARPDLFPETSLTMMHALQNGSGEVAHVAFNRFADTYREPLIRFVLCRGLGAEEAEDLVQQFFLDIIIRRKAIHALNSNTWRLRRFLRVAITRFLNSHHRTEMSVKRGGRLHRTTFDELKLQSSDSEELIHDFERAWAESILERVYQKLRLTFRRPGREAYYDALEVCIPWRSQDVPLMEIAAKFGRKNEAVAAQLKRIRDCYRDFLYAEVRQTVPHPSDIHEELKHLVRVLETPEEKEF